MSRRYLPSTSSQQPFVSQYSSDNTYPVTTLPKSHTYRNPVNTKNCCDFSDTCTNTSRHHNHYEYNHIKEPRTSNCNFSDSDTNSISYYQHNENYNNRHSKDCASVNRKSVRKVYQGPESRIQCNTTAPAAAVLPHRVAVSQFSDRPRSALSVTSDVAVHGCGGHCQTFENVCYYFMQIAFTMGILIGISLTIAGAVLRKSATRNLQVLIYIGVLLSGVSFVLLYIQCTARRKARKRKKVVLSTIREPIPLVALPRVNNEHSKTVLQQQQPLMDLNSINRRCDKYSNEQGVYMQEDQPGVVWWRRKEDC